MALNVSTLSPWKATLQGASLGSELDFTLPSVPFLENYLMSLSQGFLTYKQDALQSEVWDQQYPYHLGTLKEMQRPAHPHLLNQN